MKQKLIPVVLTAAITSVSTLCAFNLFQHHNADPFAAATTAPVPVTRVAYNGTENNTMGGAPDFQLAAEASVKSVVHIKTITNSRTVVARDPLSELFGDNYLRQYRTPEQMGSGSGVVISPDGYIVTANHVIAGTDQVKVTFNDRNAAIAKVVGTDPSSDLAVLKIDVKNLPYIQFGNSDDVHLGQWVLAVGYPWSLDATVTAGIVSAKGRSIGINATKSSSSVESFIQTDAAVNPGNSGGPLVNASGQLIGINSAIASPTGAYAGYSYAIPANIVRKVSADIIQYGAVQRAYLGIETRDFKNATAQEVTSYGLDKTEGVYVKGVSQSGAAALAGIREGDFITAVNNVKVSTVPQLLEQLSRFKPGDNVPVTYLRSGKTMTSNVELKNINGSTELVKERSSIDYLGATFRTLTAAEAKQYKTSGGVIITSLGQGILSQQTNVKKGFVVSGVNGAPVKSAEALSSALDAVDGVVQLEGFYPGANAMYYYSLQLK